jgi:cell division protein ZapE
MSGLIASRYVAMVKEGRLSPDDAQRRVVVALDDLTHALEAHRLARKGSALGWLFAKNTRPSAIKGLYLWGSVGRGKTLLVDLFFECLNVKRKRRVHFHAFMADVHARIHDWRQKSKAGLVKGDDPIEPVAAALAEEAWVLCFDEFSVRDIADAMILGRLFQALFTKGVVIVATSNVEPADLYRNGLNRALFLPFIGMIEARMSVKRLDARMDYRLDKLQGLPVYHVPADEAAKAALDHAFMQMSGHAISAQRRIDLAGRVLTVPQAAGGLARFTFDDLCDQPLGAADYLALARHFHTILIDNIPVLSLERRNAAKRFITLIDILYEHHIKLIASAAAEPHDLYRTEAGSTAHDPERFEFERTASRLIEMRSIAYLALPHGRPDSEASGNITGLVET